MGFRMLLMVLLLASSCAGMRMTQTARIRSLRAPLACRTSTLAALSDDDEELDAEDTVDSWDAQLAEMEAWAAQQKAQETSSDASSILDSDTGVDEDAHFGLGDDDDDEDAAGRALRQLTEKQASLVLRRIEEQQAAQSPPSDKAVLTSLSAVLTSLNALTAKVDALTLKVDKLQQKMDSASTAPASTEVASAEPETAPAATDATPPAPPAPPAAPEWDGNVDESAWFDDDGDDMPDWRDVRRLNNLL